jgi:hypothetical protein
VPAPFGRGYISRTVQVTTAKPGEFTKAVQTTGIITLNPRNPITIDSFKSSEGPYSLLTRYANGGVATDSTAKPAISLGTAVVKGELATGVAGTADSSKGGTAGDLLWFGPGIQPGYLDDDMNVAFPNQALPSPWSPFTMVMPNTQTAAYGGTNYNYDLSGDGAKYQTSTINIGVGKRVVVTGKNVELYVNGDFTTGGNGYIYIAPGASLTLYAGGKATISGGGIANGTGYAANLSIKGLPACTSVVISGNGDYVGTFNCPQAAMTISGNGIMFGAVIAKTFTLTGDGSVHYDEDLGGSGVLTMVSYREQ